MAPGGADHAGLRGGEPLLTLFSLIDQYLMWRGAAQIMQVCVEVSQTALLLSMYFVGQLQQHLALCGTLL